MMDPELGEAKELRKNLPDNSLMMTAAVVMKMLVTQMSETLLLLMQHQWSMMITMLVHIQY